ncbi:uncharacterized protein N0V89_007574 [Didymosphaeria variabile]|uniref:F-box domain-containing protein n=1 Tax=Didymosphaeria variabile TaxID=1932322 RepID=A0A9W9CAL3_9PLEO|nr:uncharacterized protein N0V89_007574 [Didymosphaeria variabile]KAJ4352227.1 hypothetical protein N0V89_007574 [Didymosphaeria variabile]
MVLTRAGRKRELGPPAPGGSSARISKKTKKSSMAKTSKKAFTLPALLPAQKKKPKGLLDIPPELRNRIYHFATERDDFDGWEEAVPLVDLHRGHGCGRSQWPMSKGACYLSGRRFLGLTQTCKLLRLEYRPIWLRNSSVRVRCPHLLLYIHTFYGCGSKYSNLPKLVQISYNHDIQDHIDVTQILLMRAACPNTKFEFVPHELTLDDGPWNQPGADEDCDLCEEEVMAGDMFMEEFEDYGCPHDYYRRHGYAEWLLEEEYPYLPSLNKFLAHDNGNWVEDIQSGEVIRVMLDAAGPDREIPELTIRLASDSDTANEGLIDKSMLEVARDYVSSRSLRDANTEAASLHFQLQVSGCAL